MCLMCSNAFSPLASSINIFTFYARVKSANCLEKQERKKESRFWCETKDAALLATRTPVTPLGVIFYSYLIIKAVHELHNVQQSNLKPDVFLLHWI